MENKVTEAHWMAEQLPLTIADTQKHTIHWVTPIIVFLLALLVVDAVGFPLVTYWCDDFARVARSVFLNIFHMRELCTHFCSPCNVMHDQRDNQELATRTHQLNHPQQKLPLLYVPSFCSGGGGCGSTVAIHYTTRHTETEVSTPAIKARMLYSRWCSIICTRARVPAYTHTHPPKTTSDVTNRIRCRSVSL